MIDSLDSLTSQPMQIKCQTATSSTTGDDGGPNLHVRLHTQPRNLRRNQSRDDAEARSKRGIGTVAKRVTRVATTLNAINSSPTTVACLSLCDS